MGQWLEMGWFYADVSKYWSEVGFTLSWRRSISYRNQYIDLLHKSMDWFLYDKGFRHERIKKAFKKIGFIWSTVNIHWPDCGAKQSSFIEYLFNERWYKHIKTVRKFKR